MGSVLLTRAASDHLVSTGPVVHSIGAGDATLSAWVKRRGTVSTFEAVVGFGGATFHWLMLARNAAANLYSAYMSAAATLQFNAAIATDTWVHLMLVRASGVIRGYIHGTQEAATHANSETIADAAAAVGATRPSTPGNFWDGWITRVALWSSALGAADRAALTAGVEAAAVAAASLKADWPLDGGAGGVANGQSGLRDRSAGANPLLIGGGAPLWSSDEPSVFARDGRPITAKALTAGAMR